MTSFQEQEKTEFIQMIFFLAIDDEKFYSFGLGKKYSILTHFGFSIFILSSL